jgi:hypothetical protein
MYCIVFSGRLLDGHDPMTVRKAVASRLNLDAGQVERLFSGKRVVLKKGVTEESGRVYLNVLRRLGMDAGIVHTPRAQETVQALATFKVVFWGRTLDSFDRQAVMRAAAAKLKANPAQVERMFSGSKSVLKRRVSADVGSRYVVELARIGMQINLEVETLDEKQTGNIADSTPEPEAAVIAASPELPQEQRPPGFRRHDDEIYAGLLQTQYELPETAADYVEEMVVEKAGPAAMPGSAPVVQASSYAAPLLRSPTASPARAAKSGEYVRCGTCGHRQTPGSRCRACGAELARPQPQRGQIPMDASAYANQTTILGNMPVGLMRNSVAASPQPGAARPQDLHRLLEAQGNMAQRGRKTGLRAHAPVLIGVALVISVAVWMIF